MFAMLGRVWLGVCIAAVAAPALAASLSDSSAKTAVRVTNRGHVHRYTEAIADYRAGESHLSVRKIPGRQPYPAVTLNRGVTQDSSFAAWASQARKHRPKH
ncbi:MAG TPA: phage tail protein [Caulobacteraceae bacterium]|nr:phage tail protein [Caulobacteraceae bacterium]